MSDGLVPRSDFLGLDGVTHLYTAAEGPLLVAGAAALQEPEAAGGGGAGGAPPAVGNPHGGAVNGAADVEHFLETLAGVPRDG